jgi:hypothetical protein
MTSLSRHDIEHIFQQLRIGSVPERGLETFAEGIERQRNEIHRLLDMARKDEGLIKFLRAPYGGGKSFMARLATLDAQAKGFATSFVVVSDNDLKFHRFDDVYAKVVENLATDMCQRGALSDILDRWIGEVEDAMISGGADENDPDFDEKLRERLGQDIQAMTQGKAPEDFVRVVRAIFELKEEGDLATAGALLSWLSGSKNVASKAKKRAQVKGDVESRTAMAYLHGINEIIKAAGYNGLLIVIDEAETILRSRSDTRHKSLNGIRQIADASSQYKGLIWLFTGTPEFFDTRRGVAGLEPLHERIRFIKQGNFASSRQPQLELHPFDEERLRDVALKLRELYPTQDRYRLEQKITVDFIEKLVASVVEGFRGDVGVVPRQFLRSFVNEMDLVEEHPGYDPASVAGFKLEQDDGLKPEEAAAAGFSSTTIIEDEGDEDDLIPSIDQW